VYFFYKELFFFVKDDKSHYCSQRLYRVFWALSKKPFALGKGFTKYHTRQRGLVSVLFGKGLFAECQM